MGKYRRPQFYEKNKSTFQKVEIKTKKSIGKYKSQNSWAKGINMKVDVSGNKTR